MYKIRSTIYQELNNELKTRHMIVLISNDYFFCSADVRIDPIDVSKRMMTKYMLSNKNSYHYTNYKCSLSIKGKITERWLVEREGIFS